MATHLSVGKSKALPVSATEDDPATIHNAGSGTLYYAKTSDVRADPKAGHDSLAAGSGVQVKAPHWIVASASSHVVVLRNDDRDQD